MKLIENKQAITLAELNQYSFVWVEEEYQRKLHDGINTTPLDRFINDKNIGLEAPTMQEMINAFRRDESRKLRRSDCSISLESIRYEIPYVYRHLRKIMIRYATWDLSNVHIVNEMGKELMPIFPVDKAANSSSGRKSCGPVNSSVEQTQEPVADEIAPLMKKYIQNFEERGLIPAYLPTEEKNT